LEKYKFSVLKQPMSSLMPLKTFCI